MFLKDSEFFPPSAASSPPAPPPEQLQLREANRNALVCKRAIDIAGALSFFIVMGWLFLGLWLTVAIKQGRPAIYRHRRIGRNGKEFECLKFRSMILNSDQVLSEFLDSSPAARAEWHRDFKLKNDPRVTPFGRFLRRTSLDELPQFWNVLRGDMSLVGPRPIVRKELEKYYRSSASQFLQVKPGITGLWQINGRHEMQYDARVALDCSYARHWSNAGDLKIMLKTFGVVIRRKGSY
jgi:exopolysaccharide production protein ExoY